MASFKIPPISPLVGSTLFSFLRTLKGRKIDGKNYFKLGLTLIVVLIASIFQWFDRVYFGIKIKKRESHKSPIFIVGHWRTGTTFLHNLIATDPQMGYVSTYQSVFPNNLRSKFIFRTFMKAHIPEKRPGDNVKLGVDFPQEDEFALSNMNPFSFYQYMYFPLDYVEYYNKYIRFKGISDHVKKKWQGDYRLMVNKAVIDSRGEIPVIKNPCNTGRIKELLELYPGARFITTIRNPVIVILSSRKFFSELFKTIALQSYTEYELEDLILDIYNKITHDYLEQKSLIPEEQLIEIMYDQFEEEPLKSVEYIYKKFNISGYESVHPLFVSYLKSLSGYKKNKHIVEKEFLDRILKRCDFAMKTWNYNVPENVVVQ